MHTIFGIIRDVHRSERGQMWIMALLLIIVGLGALMLTADVAYWLRDRRSAQNQADAVALAGAQELPDTSAAVTEAEDWAVKNGVSLDQITAPPCSGSLINDFCFEDLNGDGKMDLIRARVERESNSFVAQVFNIGNPSIGATAAAAKVRSSGACLMPWAIDAVTEDAFATDTHFGVLGDPPDDGKLFIFQLSAKGDFAGEDGSSGNFGALGIYGSNTNDYRDAIINECGSRDQDACDSGSQTVEFGKTLSCPAQTGELGRNTATALNARDERYFGTGPYTPCDASTYDQARQLAKGSCAPARLVPIAVIKDFPPQGSSGDVEIYAIDNFYIAAWDRAPKWGDGDADGDPDNGMVWGYLIQDELVATPAWQFVAGVGGPQNAFGPTIVALVE
ncbi:MAG: Tad domain-containing protein [Chloroflexi bacterium]|nr:Tad domain-containing protein [Chloroflexota bacterium]